MSQRLLLFLSVVATIFACKPAFAASIFTILECESLLIAVQKDSSIPAFARKNLIDSVAHMQKFRTEILDPANQARPKLISEGVWPSEKSAGKSRAAVANEIAGIENHFESTITGDQRSGAQDSLLMFGLTRKGSASIARFILDWFNVDSDIQKQHDFAFYKYLSFSRTELFSPMISSLRQEMLEAASLSESGKWVFAQTAFKLRKSTVTGLLNANADLTHPSAELALRLEAETRVGGTLIGKLIAFIRAHQSGLSAREVWDRYFKETWVIADFLITHEENGEPKLSVVMRLSGNKPRSFHRKKKKRENTELESQLELGLKPGLLLSP